MFVIRKKKFSFKGFTLIEVLVAVAIFSISMVALFHVFSISLRSIRVTQDYTRAKLLLQNKMFNLETKGLPSNLPENFKVFPTPFDNFKWKIDTSEVFFDNKKLIELHLTVQLPQRTGNRIIEVVNYIE